MADFMFQNMAYRATVYRTGVLSMSFVVYLSFGSQSSVVGKEIFDSEDSDKYMGFIILIRYVTRREV